MAVKRKCIAMAMILFLPAVFLVGCSRAHIKVVDQYDKPIEGVLIRQSLYHPSWIPLTFPGNTGNTEIIIKHTNAKGRVVLPEDSSGFPVNITHVEKAGYQFRALEQIERDYWGRRDSGLRPDEYKFTYKNPLIIRGWKREEQPDLTYAWSGERCPVAAVACSLILDKEDRPSLGWHEEQHATITPPIIVKLMLKIDEDKQRDEPDAVRGRIWIEGAMVQVTDDLFMNLAPSAGYQAVVDLSLRAGTYIDRKQLFIKAEDGSFYGGGMFSIYPPGTRVKFPSPDEYVVKSSFWFNFNGSRNIMRHPSEIIWDLEKIR